MSSPDFSDTNNATIDNGAAYEPTPAQAKAWFRSRVQPQTPACLTSAFKALIDYAIHHPSKPSDKVPAGVTYGASSVGEMSFPLYGDQSVAYRAVIPVSYNALNISIYADFIVLRKGRAHAALSFESSVTPVDSTTEERLTALTLRRLHHTT